MFDIIITASFSSQVLQLLHLSFIDLKVLYSTRKIVYSQSLKFIGRNEIKTGSPWTVVSLAIETLASIWQTWDYFPPEADLFSSTSLFFSIPGRTLDPRSHYPLSGHLGQGRPGRVHPTLMVSWVWVGVPRVSMMAVGPINWLVSRLLHPVEVRVPRGDNVQVFLYGTVAGLGRRHGRVKHLTRGGRGRGLGLTRPHLVLVEV